MLGVAMPDVWATASELDAGTQERLAEVLETRGADAQRQAGAERLLLSSTSSTHFPPSMRKSSWPDSAWYIPVGVPGSSTARVKPVSPND
jgi:hypothetical protein